MEQGDVFEYNHGIRDIEDARRADCDYEGTETRILIEESDQGCKKHRWIVEMKEEAP